MMVMWYVIKLLSSYIGVGLGVGVGSIMAAAVFLVVIITIKMVAKWHQKSE